MEYTQYRMAFLHHAERLKDVHPRLAAFARMMASKSRLDVCVVTGPRDSTGVAEKWAIGRTVPGRHAGEPGYPPMGETVTKVHSLDKAPHAIRQTPEGDFACAVDLQFQVAGELLEGKREHEAALYQWMGELAEAEGLGWGGHFPDGQKDQAHIQIPQFREYPLPAEGVA